MYIAPIVGLFVTASAFVHPKNAVTHTHVLASAQEEVLEQDSQGVTPSGASTGVVNSVKELPGITYWPGFWDPWELSAKEDDTRIKYYREAELKHGRVAMLAAFGFLFAEKIHPLFGGTIDVPSVVAFQATPLQLFWPLVLTVIAWFESASIDTFNFPADGPWTLKPDYVNGDLGCVPDRT